MWVRDLDAGIVDATTMHEFDALCLTPVKKFSTEERSSSVMKHTGVHRLRNKI